MKGAIEVEGHDYSVRFWGCCNNISVCCWSILGGIVDIVCRAEGRILEIALFFEFLFIGQLTPRLLLEECFANRVHTTTTYWTITTNADLVLALEDCCVCVTLFSRKFKWTNLKNISTYVLCRSVLKTRQTHHFGWGNFWSSHVTRPRFVSNLRLHDAWKDTKTTRWKSCEWCKKLCRLSMVPCKASSLRREIACWLKGGEWENA